MKDLEQSIQKTDKPALSGGVSAAEFIQPEINKKLSAAEYKREIKQKN